MPAKSKSAFMPKGYEMNKLMEEMKKKKVNIASSVQIRNDILESQKELIIRTSLTDYMVLNNYQH